jgi:hypothetical protein
VGELVIKQISRPELTFLSDIRHRLLLGGHQDRKSVV